MTSATLLVMAPALICAVTACCISSALPAPTNERAQQLAPFWKGAFTFEEPLFFAQRQEGVNPSARLLFVPKKVLSVTSATREVTYVEGKDYRVDPTASTVTLLPDSRIPVTTLTEMYPPADSPLPNIGEKKGDPTTHIMYGEGTFFHNRQVVVTYTHSPGLWRGYKPAYAGRMLPKTMAKLKAKQPLTLAISGDSISTGANASGVTQGPPFSPPYPIAVAEELARHYGAKVRLANRSVGGWNTDNGVADAPKLAEEKPDLVIIAYGMNDTPARNADRYQENIKRIMAEVLTSSPDAEFILVASSTGNYEWSPMYPEQFPIYRDKLAALCGNGVVLADMTAMWTDLLKRKAFQDLTGNGVNHPNDFGHRVYAQVILGLLIAGR